LVEVVDPRSGKKVFEHKRIWFIVNKRQQHLLFLSSDHYSDFQQQYIGAGASYPVWHEVLGKMGNIVCNPKPESYVDEKKH
jgi:hypothetical protein